MRVRSYSSRSRSARSLGLAAFTAAVALAVTACGDGGNSESSGSATSAPAASRSPSVDVSESTATTDTTTPAASEDAGSSETPSSVNTDAPSGGDRPAWAEGSTDVGKKIGSFKTASWSVDVYQVGTAKTESDSMFVDPKTNKNILPKGSEVVFVNFVVTNTSSAAIPLSISLADPQLTAADWRYITSQPGAAHSSEYDAMKVSDDGYTVGSSAPFVVEPGQMFAQATSIKYVPGQKAEAAVGLIPVDSAGKLLHDKKEEGTTTVTIK